jgi:predicted Zn-dependent protease
LQRVDGLLYGPDPDQGVIDGARFIHPRLRFALTFPDDWQIVNGRTQVMAQAPDQSGLLLLQLADLPAGSLERGAVQWMSQQGFQQLRGQSTRVNGLDAHVGTYVGQMEQAGTVGVRALLVAHRDQVFVVAGLAPEARFSAFDRAFDNTLASFRPISASEASRFEPNRVEVYRARRGDTWERLADRAARESVTPATLAALNGRSVNEPPPVGEPIKIVVAD